MAHPFKVVNNVQEVQASGKWQDAPKFNSKNEVKTYKGREYRLVSKKERDFTLGKRIGRATLGVFAVLGSLGFALLSKSIRKLFTKEKETVRYGILQKNTKELTKDLTGNDLQTEEQLIHRFGKDYAGLAGHIKIDNKIIETPPIPGVIGRTIDEALIPKTLVDMFPEEIKAYFGDDFPAIAPTLALLLQQGIVAEFGLRGPELIDDPIPNTTFSVSNVYPHFEFSKVNNEIFLLVKGKGFLAADPTAKHERDYSTNMLINLSNPKAKVELKAQRFLPFKRTKKLIQDLKNAGLETNEKLIHRLQIDYSALDGHIKLDNQTVDMGKPAFAENRGSGIAPPNTLEEMFPDAIKDYFGGDFPRMAPKLALLLQQGIANRIIEGAVKLIDDPIPDTTFILESSYPDFEFSKVNDDIVLLIKGKGRLIDNSSGDVQRNYSISMSINLSNPEAMVDMTIAPRGAL